MKRGQTGTGGDCSAAVRMILAATLSSLAAGVGWRTIRDDAARDVASTTPRMSKSEEHDSD